jgi:glycosyltransferase involved in cell wall biosynthesis
MNFTFIVPYYRNVAMLVRQIEEWRKYPKTEDLQIILVDDASPEEAAPLLQAAAPDVPNLRAFRITNDIPWNRAAARNFGAIYASTDWILHTDIDHIMPVETAEALLKFAPVRTNWYRFARYRVGKADFTRRKDDLDDNIEFGKIKPHMDSYLCERELYMRLGGYDEDYSGSLGGGTPFVRELQSAATMIDLPEPYTLHVHTTDSVPDASDIHLSRDTTRFKQMQREKARGGTKAPMGKQDHMEIDLGR